MSLTLARLGIVAGSFPIAAGGDFESIATVTVGSGGAANIEFTSIPATYQHLQVRMITRTARAANLDAVNVRVGNGSVDTGNNYSHHYLYGDGSSAGAGGAGTQSFAYIAQSIAANSTAGMFGGAVIDILDYANTSKNKTIRMIGGCDRNGAGEMWVSSGLWQSTSAVTHLRIYSNTANNLAQYSEAALYGVKAP